MRSLLLLLLLPLAAQAKESLFESSSPLELEIKTDIQALLPKFPKEDAVVPGTFAWGAQKLPVELQARGGVRKGLCPQLPPIKVVLPKGKRPSPFAHMDRDLKLVTSCKPAPSPTERDLVFREYVQYRLLKAAELPAFQVRLANVKYINSDDSLYSSGPAFFIENIKDASERLGYSPEMASRPLPEQIAELIVTEMLLHNFDFMVPRQEDRANHNVRTYRGTKNEILAMIPYDFDLSNLSRELHPGQPEDSRRYIEMYLDKPEMLHLALPYLAQIAAHREALLAEIANSPLSDSDKKGFAESVEEFCATAAAVVKENSK